MSDFFSNKTYVYALSLCLSATSLWYLMNMRQRKKKKSITINSTETYFAVRNSSWFSLDKLGFRRTESDGSDITKKTQTENKSSSEGVKHDHPEGPNIGFESNPSWLSTPRANRKIFISSSTSNNNINDATQTNKLIVVMVGLPGRGKTYIARKVARYLRWIGFRTRAFTLAKYRLDKFGTKTADFFDPSCEGNYQQRVKLMLDALDDSLRYLSRGGDIAILDGSNCTIDRRQLIRDRVAKEENHELLFIESLGGVDDELTEKQLEELSNSPDFLDKEDYKKRMQYYRTTYESLADNEGSFIKVSNYGRDIILHEIHGFLRSKIVSFVMNLHTESRPLFLCRHGESEFNAINLIGGDCGLSEKGVAFSKALTEYMMAEELTESESKELVIWTSTMRRAKETVVPFKGRCNRLLEWRALREIEAGICDGLSYDQIKELFPEEFQVRSQDKLRYRYPRGESYIDVINRLEPIIFEIERQKEPLMIIAHQAVLRCLYAYFLDLPLEEAPYLSIPLHTLIRLDLKPYGCREKRLRICMEGYA